MSAIFSNTLKSRKLHFHQWKPENNGPVQLLKVTVLAHWNYQNVFKLRMVRMEVDCGLQKVGPTFFQDVPLCFTKSARTSYDLLSLRKFN